MNEPSVRCSHSALVAISDLKPNPKNPNKHPDGQIALLAKIINHQGWRAPVVVSKRSGLIVVGHGRYQAALLLGVKAAPVDYQDFQTESDEMAHLLADNRLAELSETDDAKLADMLKELAATDLDFTGFSAIEIDDIISLGNPEEDGGMGNDITDEVPCEKEAFIVPIALTRKQWSAWVKKKDEAGLKSCKGAFVKIMGLGA